MFQQIVDTIITKDIQIHSSENGTMFSAFELDLFDEETLGLDNSEVLIQSLLADLPEGRTLRIYFKSVYSTEQKDDHSRQSAISNIGYIKNRAVVVLEKYPGFDFSFLKKKSKSLKKPFFDFGIIKDSGHFMKCMGYADILTFFPNLDQEINHSFQTLDIGIAFVSILRLVKQTEFGMNLQTLSHIKDTLPVPYTICCSIQTVPQTTAETLLRRRSKQNVEGSDIKESRKYAEAQADLEEVSLNGSRLFRFEWQIVLENKVEEQLRIHREEVKRKLQPLGEIYIESVGALQSFKCFFPGEQPHFTLLEKDSVLAAYVPLITRGDSASQRRIDRKSLAVHRKDESLTYLDIFDPRYESFSWCIFGRPGTGKSVLVNAITRALAFDAGVKVIKIDVGGSHSRETEMLGGIEKTLTLNEPTGINPFNVITELGATKEAIQILASFLEVLLLEEGESKLTKTMKSDVERAIQHYAEGASGPVSLEGFNTQVQDFPRRELLKRWVGTGVYGNAFAVSSGDSRSSDEWTESHLTYFNFSKISQALDPDYAQGGLAAVMAQFNLEMLKKSQHKKRIVFIADETPFFIKKCFSFFNLSIANVRKEGHGFITVAQKTAHVVVNDDTGILDNSPNKVFFSMDGDDESFMGRTQTDIETLNKIRSLERKQGEFSEALLKDSIGERVLKIRLSGEEYWSYTSKDEDREKYNQLRLACPDLGLEEIIKCLSLS